MNTIKERYRSYIKYCTTAQGKRDNTNSGRIILSLVIGAQLAGIVHLLYSTQASNSHIPAAFIELNILAALNAIILVFLLFSSKQKTKLWLVTFSLSVGVLAVLGVTYMVMGLSGL